MCRSSESLIVIMCTLCGRQQRTHTLHTHHTAEYETHISKSTGHYSHRIHEHAHTTQAHKRTHTTAHTEKHSPYKSTFNSRDNMNTCSSYRTLLCPCTNSPRKFILAMHTQKPRPRRGHRRRNSECEFSNFTTRTDVKSEFDECVFAYIVVFAYGFAWAFQAINSQRNLARTIRKRIHYQFPTI